MPEMHAEWGDGRGVGARVLHRGWIDFWMGSMLRQRSLVRRGGVGDVDARGNAELCLRIVLRRLDGRPGFSPGLHPYDSVPRSRALQRNRASSFTVLLVASYFKLARKGSFRG